MQPVTPRRGRCHHPARRVLELSSMPYATNIDLPAPVGRALLHDAQGTYRAAFNNAGELPDAT